MAEMTRSANRIESRTQPPVFRVQALHIGLATTLGRHLTPCFPGTGLWVCVQPDDAGRRENVLALHLPLQAAQHYMDCSGSGGRCDVSSYS